MPSQTGTIGRSRSIVHKPLMTLRTQSI